MSPSRLRTELNLEQPIETMEHECLLNIVYTATLIGKIAYGYFSKSAVTDVQFNLLMQLKYTREKRLSQVELSRRLVVNKANVTGVIDRLEKAGFVLRIPHDTDRRIKMIAITEKGLEIVTRLESGYFEEVSRLMSAFTEPEMVNLVENLEKLREVIRKHGLPGQ
jgi:DNA-binding MarR family transcriptional regulator